MNLWAIVVLVFAVAVLILENWDDIVEWWADCHTPEDEQ